MTPVACPVHGAGYGRCLGCLHEAAYGEQEYAISPPPALTLLCDDLKSRCQALAARTRRQCERSGYYDPCTEEYRCLYHETRGFLEAAG